MRRLIQLIVLCALLGNSADATQRLIVRDTAGQAALQLTCALLGCNVSLGLGDPAGQVFLLTLPNTLNLNSLIQSLLSVLAITDAEVDSSLNIVQGAPPPIPPALYNNSLVPYFGTNVWQGYTTQPAAQIVGISNAQSTFGVSGAGTVAVIDTGVDPNQPVLQPVLVAGYDFTRNQAIGSEMPDITQPVNPVTNNVPASYLNSYGAAVLDQSTVSVVDNSQYAAFGHGTLTSGLIHLVAPRALIMPLKAFQASGYGYTSDIIRAIYWAGRQHARVISMSFSIPQSSTELGKALSYATGAGMICVASAGNNSSSTAVYPASYSNVIGVASTDNNDVRSTFSNYGSWVSLAAPGEGIVTTYPWGAYGAVWGTSFSAPLVSGTVSLMLQLNWNLSQAGAASALSHAQPVDPTAGLGYGRLDIVQALQAAASGQ